MSLLDKKVRIKNLAIVVGCFPVVVFICILIVSRNPELPDYSNYLMMYNTGELRSDIEISYSAIVRILFLIPNGFYILLLIYAIIGFFLKYMFACMYILPNEREGTFILFAIAYALSFMFIWDFVQIRASAGISFFIFGVFSSGKFRKAIFLLLAILFHYSMIMPVGAFSVFYFIKKEKYRIVALPIVIITPIILLLFSHYAVSYGKTTYNVEPKPIYGTIYSLMYLMLIVIFYFKAKIIYYRQDVLALYYCGITIMFISILLNSGFPALSDRFVDIASFCLFTCLFFIKPCRWSQRLFLLLFIVFVSLMRFRVIWSVFDVPIIKEILPFII